MRKYCFFLLLPIVVLGSRPPAAVFEDVFELGRPTAAFQATTESRNGMKAYLRKKYRQMRDPGKRASIMAAYTAAHERYQISEENRNDRIRDENMRQISAVRTKRLDEQHASAANSKRLDIIPREIIKFELADAMIPPDTVSQYSDSLKVRTKRERSEPRIVPIPRQIIRFELSDVIVPKKKTEPALSPDNTGAVSRRQRRSANPNPRDYVKFEVQDAKVLETETRSNTKITDNLRHPFTSSDSYKRGKVFDEVVDRLESSKRSNVGSKKEKRESLPETEVDDGNDMSPEESRRIKVRGKKQKQIANYEDLPLGVQKAIDIAIKENERINSKGRDESSDVAAILSTPKYYFGDKKPKTKKPYSAATKTNEPKFMPNAKLAEIKLPVVEEESNGQTGFLPSNPHGATFKESADITSEFDKDKAPSSVQGIPKSWWSYSDLRRPKRLYHKPSAAPLVISPQYVNTFKPSSEQSKMNDLSPGYHRRPILFSPVTVEPSTSSEYFSYNRQIANGPEEVMIKERPKIKYVIKKIPVPVQMNQPRTKISVQPSISISYDKDITSPGSSESTAVQGYDNPYGPIELQYGNRISLKKPVHTFQNMKIVIPDPKEQTIIDATQTPATYPNEIDTTGSSIAALSALIGQRPSVQLKGLNDLLHMPVPVDSNEQQQRPQESTAPVTFPETSTPSPKQSRSGYRSVQIDHVPKAVYDDKLYHTMPMSPQLQVPISKEYTPIKEVLSDVIDTDITGPTISSSTHDTYVVGSHKSTPAPIVEHHEFNEDEAGHESNSYRHINIHSTPVPPLESISHHYQEQHHHHHHHHVPSDEHYDDSEGYAFGYRVRDFHTGNDFGHVQNHDNGVTRGEYHILLPDGRVQNVRYTADDKGFHADVTYESVHSTPHKLE